MNSFADWCSCVNITFTCDVTFRGVCFWFTLKMIWLAFVQCCLPYLWVYSSFHSNWCECVFLSHRPLLLFSTRQVCHRMYLGGCHDACYFAILIRIPRSFLTPNINPGGALVVLVEIPTQAHSNLLLWMDDVNTIAWADCDKVNQVFKWSLTSHIYLR